jgi:glycosyltransferase involved in cell wall biosynthesis
MTVTAIICTYRRPQMLHESLASVMNQTRLPEEVIVVFDGCDDGSFEEFNSTYPGVRFFFQVNQGRSIAANKAVFEAKSDYVAFLDDDDIWYPNKLEIMLSEMERMNSKAANHFFDTLSPDRRITKGDCDHMLARNDECPCLIIRNPCAYSTTVVSREIYLTAGGMAPFQNHADDWTFYMNVSRLESWHTVMTSLGAYRIHSTQGSSHADAGLRILAQIFAYYYGGRPSRLVKSDVSFAETDLELVRFAASACWSAVKKRDFRRLCQTMGIYLAFSGALLSLLRLLFCLPPILRVRRGYRKS